MTQDGAFLRLPRMDASREGMKDLQHQYGDPGDCSSRLYCDWDSRKGSSGCRRGGRRRVAS
jgi:hypothetical protein